MSESRGKMLQRCVNLLNVVGNIALIAIVVWLGVRYFGDRSTGSATLLPQGSVPANWLDETKTGISWGDPAADLKVVEFMDLECPFCRTWHARLDSLVAEFPEAVHVTLHHLPLSRVHRNAERAAVALECGDRQGQGKQMTRALLAHQAQFSDVEWSTFAEKAGVPDRTQFLLCLDFPSDSFPRVAYGIDLARANRIRATPTVWVNGEVGTPTLAQLKERVRRAR